MGVAQRSVRDRHRAQLAQPTGETVGTEALEQLAAAVGDRAGRPRLAPAFGHGKDVGGQFFFRALDHRGRPVGPVDGDVGHVIEQAGTPVGAAAPAQQAWAFLDEGGREVAGNEIRLGQQRL